MIVYTFAQTTTYSRRVITTLCKTDLPGLTPLANAPGIRNARYAGFDFEQTFSIVYGYMPSLP